MLAIKGTDGGGGGADFEPSALVEQNPPRALISAKKRPKKIEAVEPVGLDQGQHDSIDGERLLSLPAVAGILGVSVRTVYRLIAEEELPQPVHVRALARMPVTDVRAYLVKVQALRGEPPRVQKEPA